MGEGRGAELLKIAVTVPAMSLLEGSVKPKGREEESRRDSGGGRDRPVLVPAVLTPRTTVPRYRDRGHNM